MSDVVHADEKALQQAALDRLKLIGAVTRYQADAIRFAVEIGIPKQRIHELTGRSRSAIDQTLAREALRPRSPCDYCLHEHFQAARRGEDILPLRDASGYLIYRIGDRPEIVAQRLCTEHLSQDRENRLPSSARRVLTPHMPDTPGAIVYSLGGLRDDTQAFRNYFGSGAFPEWKEIRRLLESPTG